MFSKEPIIETLLESLTDGVFTVDAYSRITSWNTAAEKITGVPKSKAVGKPCCRVLGHVGDRGEDVCGMGCAEAHAADAKKGATLERTAYLSHAKGHRVPVLIRTTRLHDEEGLYLGSLEVFRDRSHDVAALEQIRKLTRLATVDPLTGIGNRRSTERFLHARLAERARYGWAFGVLFVDLDEFKGVNDQLGHGAGDELLKVVALTLEHNLRSGDFVGRWSGEEFLVVVSEVDAEGLAKVAEKLRALIERSVVRIDRRTANVTASIGATLARKNDSLISSWLAPTTGCT